MIHRLVSITAILLVSACAARAQSEAIGYGVMAGLSINFHAVGFQGLPGYPTCCPEYTGGAGAGVVLGGFVDFPVAGDIRVAFRPGWFVRSATLREEEKTTVIVSGRATDAVIDHIIDAKLATLGAEFLVGWELGDVVRLHLGSRAGAVVASSYEGREELSEPAGVGTFENNRRTRNEHSDEIPGAAGFNTALAVGIGFAIPLTSSRAVILAPEILYTVDLEPVSTAVDWRTSSLRIGATLGLGRGRAPIPLAEVPVPPGDAPTASAPFLLADIDAVAVGVGGEEAREVVVHVEEFISTNMRPLLNYVFFDEASAVLPARYARRTPAAAGLFDESALHSLDPIATYHEVLNIVGHRMRLQPEARVSLTGAASGEGQDGGDSGLGRARAEAVRNYLAEVWGIEPSRLRIDARTLPATPSDTAVEDGRAENRRVEIVSDDPRIMEPVITRDTLRVVTPPLLRFRTVVSGDASRERWRLAVEQGGRELKQLDGTGTPPAVIDWETNREQLSAPRSGDSLRYTLEVAGPVGVAARASGTLPVELITISRKREERIGDRVIDRYRLILFDFDRAELDAANARLAAFIRGQVQPGSRVTVTGHTDRIGEEEYNRELSEARARATADAIGAPDAEINGIGESPLLYDNELPEGRFYSRTVQVVVETEVK